MWRCAGPGEGGTEMKGSHEPISKWYSNPFQNYALGQVILSKFPSHELPPKIAYPECDTVRVNDDADGGTTKMG